MTPDPPPQNLFLRLAREHALAVGRLTETQLAEAIRQAMPDFVRNVHASSDGTHRQSVVYLPGREAAEWRRKYYELLDRQSTTGINLDPPTAGDVLDSNAY